MSYYVRPRYTPGSPGLVSREIALRLVVEEREAYGNELSGIFGPKAREVAQALGLDGIVERQSEIRDGWEIHDLLSDRVFLRLDVPARKVQSGDKIVGVKSGSYTLFSSVEGKPTFPVVACEKAEGPRGLYFHAINRSLLVTRDATVTVERSKGA